MTSTNKGFEESTNRGVRTKDSRSQEAEELVRRIQAVEKAHGSGALGSEEHVGMAQGFKKLVNMYKGSELEDSKNGRQDSNNLLSSEPESLRKVPRP